jgi:hypothetical protein
MGKPVESILHPLAANILFLLFKQDSAWPLEFLELYFDDALGCRNWVDADESQLFISNLLFWTKTINKNRKLLANKAFIKEDHKDGVLNSMDQYEDQEGDLMVEDIISSGISASKGIISVNTFVVETIPDLCDRYRDNAIDALDLTLSVLYSRCDNSVPSQTLVSLNCFVPSIISSSDSKTVKNRNQPTCNSYLLKVKQSQVWTLLSTLSLFCEIDEIKILCINCLEVWFRNVAIADYAKKLSVSLISCIGSGVDVEASSSLLDTMSCNSNNSPMSTQLQEVDSFLLEQLVKVRLRNNSTEPERKAFVSLIKRIPFLTSNIIFILLYEDIWANNGTLKSDSVKLVCYLLQQLSSIEKGKFSEKTIFIKEILKADSNLDRKLDEVVKHLRVAGSSSCSYKTLSQILGSSFCLFVQICFVNVSSSDKNDSNSDVNNYSFINKNIKSGSGSGSNRRLERPWDAGVTRSLCDGFVRIVRTLGAHEFDYISLHKRVFSVNTYFSAKLLGFKLVDHEVMVSM